MRRSTMKYAFQDDLLSIPMPKIVPLRIVDHAIKGSSKYHWIKASIGQIGLVIPLIVYPHDKRKGTFHINDGHLRHAALQDLGHCEAPCIVSKVDDTFTYNQKVNRLTSVQEHFMIRKVLALGVKESKIAKALGVDVAKIASKVRLLDGICPAAVELLKVHHLTEGVLWCLRKVKDDRQIEMAQLMINANDFTVRHAKAMVLNTCDGQLRDLKVKQKSRVGMENLDLLQRELEKMEKDYLRVNKSLGPNVSGLVTIIAYLRKLFDNARVVRYIMTRHREQAEHLQKIMEIQHGET